MGTHRSSLTLECEACRQPFHPWKLNKPGRFCSRACAPRGRVPTTPSIECGECGIPFRPSSAGRKFCSRQCWRAAFAGRRTVNGEGYVLVYMPDHPSAYKRSGQILEHRLVMAEQLGRLLDPTETVHHINGDRTDNRPENLQLRQGRHGSGVRHQCLDCGSSNVAAVELATFTSGG